MRGEAFRRRLALRIDVDFTAGLLRAVPRFLDLLAEEGCRATFFVVAGSNRPERAFGKLFRPGYLRRLWRLGPARILTRLAIHSRLGAGDEFLESRASRHVLQRIVAEGHELAVHGYDHAWWADNVWLAGDDRLTAEIERGYETMNRACPQQDLAWGSPSWRTTEVVLRELRRRGVPYLAECWGRGPFLTRLDDESVIPIPHLPITLPSLESLMPETGYDADDASGALLDGRPEDRFDVVCLHDYFEGLLRPELFGSFLAACRRRELRCMTLREAARAVKQSATPLPMRPLVRAPLAGFMGEVSWQRDG